MVELVASIGFGHAGTSSDHVLEGWGPVEPTHRWTVGAQSSLWLPIPVSGPDYVIVVNARPWLDQSCLRSQTVMIAVNDRLLTTIQLDDHRVLAFALPPGLADHDRVMLSFHHLNHQALRPSSGLDHAGQALGLLVTAIHVFRLNDQFRPATTYLTFPAGLQNRPLEKTIVDMLKVSTSDLMMRFESIGHNCEFGLIQREFGAEPLGLLRFASVVTHTLVDGLMARFAGVGTPGTTRVYLSDPPDREYKVYEQLYYSWYSTGRKEADTTCEVVLEEQCRKLTYLQRKFVEDLREGNKIYVLTRAEPLTEAEALAVFCALQAEGPNTLLWTTHGDPRRTGEVTRILPRFLRGELGWVDNRYYATTDAWLSVLANTVLAVREAQGPPAVTAPPTRNGSTWRN